MDKNQLYLLELHKQTDSRIESLRSYAEQNNVPIVDRLTLDMIKQLIRIHQPQQILEIGTAIGYSSMQFASVSSDIHVTTIERDEAMLTQAKNNRTTFGFNTQIRQIVGNALEQFEQVNDRVYDMIFIDAAKAQSQKFFELYTPLLKEGGMVITDNVLYHGFVADIDIVRNRNVRQMVKKVQSYNEWLMNNENYTTNFLNIDDGLAISIKGASK
ncbi:O-methyltransferase [Staphylococcus gallinarum]|uniref:tRNA 5-hydroxyuridine methyltransferase n=1 Tax=Staphylococcus gallinarum TaxID=1293 RepID=A0A0D0SRA0_STAGA|nr:O-methyltransferase [Staphylococcus gallinarum]KIR11719.1 methyltransferase [Staphylococcus gallinarum]MCD8786357.1 O-methyltransferase [Staphylococcus gallinarum]MCD8842859.1 O-methyltransferase [Staphylococcus gallinarum]MCD8858677.1 O-methyltransferase [Staphylococcus gallinarum]MCD8899111.1 O-methyltransferase [Staphylococcus gallinarum]